MENKKQTQMIYLKDLLFAALHRYRGILAVMLSFAVLLGGLKAISGFSALKNASGDISKYQAALALYETECASIDQQIVLLERSIESQQSYLTESVLMQLNPYGFYEATLTIYVDTGYQILPGMNYQTPDKTSTILNSYQTALIDSQTLQQLAQAVDIQPQYVSELISVTVPSSSHTLVVTVKYASADGAQTLISLICEQAEAVHQQVSQAIASHDMNMVTQNVHATVDSSLAATQKTELDRLTTLQTALKNVQDKQAALTPPVAPTITTSGVVKDTLVYFVVGAVVGAFLAILVILAAHIASGKIYASRNLLDRLSIKVLGCISSASPKKSVDRWLRKLEGRNVADVSQQAELLAVNVKNRCGQGDRLLVVSDADAAASAPVVQALRNAGLQLDDRGSLLQDKAALEALAGCNSVLLILQCHKSLYTNAEQEMCIVRDCGKQLLGCILIDG